MKKINILIYMIIMILIISCEKEPYINFGFDSPVNNNSKGLVIADISHNIQNIYLNGVISLTEGEVEVNLLNPSGIAVYSETILAPNELNINETFEARPGYWKLKYKSNDGLGEIDLHLQKY